MLRRFFLWSMVALMIFAGGLAIAVMCWSMNSPAPMPLQQPLILPDLDVPPKSGLDVAAENNLTVASMQEDARRYYRLVTRGAGWIDILNEMSQTSDPFTLFLLKIMERETVPLYFRVPGNGTIPLTDEEFDKIHRAIEQIESRRGPNPEALAVGEIGPSMIRTAVADLHCFAIELAMQAWLFQSLRPQVADPSFEKELKRLRNRLEVYDVEGKKNETYTTRTASRIIQYFPKDDVPDGNAVAN